MVVEEYISDSELFQLKRHDKSWKWGTESQRVEIYLSYSIKQATELTLKLSSLTKLPFFVVLFSRQNRISSSPSLTQIHKNNIRSSIKQTQHNHIKSSVLVLSFFNSFSKVSPFWLKSFILGRPVFIHLLSNQSFYLCGGKRLKFGSFYL